MCLPFAEAKNREGSIDFGAMSDQFSRRIELQAGSLPVRALGNNISVTRGFHEYLLAGTVPRRPKICDRGTTGKKLRLGTMGPVSAGRYLRGRGSINNLPCCWQGTSAVISLSRRSRSALGRWGTQHPQLMVASRTPRQPARDSQWLSNQEVWHALGNRTVSRLPVGAHYSAH